ncbi:MAG TPA: rRNA maturation RNase YbeY [Chloroflexota bacterium]|jgi:probable rRNA maturation factor|nr:rRNA maturation RNase YbeY [Chloroflexota bacterium]
MSDPADVRHLVLVAGPDDAAEWFTLAERILPRALAQLAASGHAPARGEVSVTLVDDSRIQELNRLYRGIDAPTDVLSFSQLEGTGPQARDLPADYPVPLGDIVISIPRLRAQAVDYGHSEARELGFLLVHGLLHLLGYDHQTPDDEQEMRAAEEELLAAAHLTRESAPQPD